MQGILAGLEGAAKEFFLVQNASLGAAYLILAARALGLDTGPMAGFDRPKTDEAFFAGTSWRSILLINLGYGIKEKLMPRNPRLDVDEAAKIV
jgi:3-hydroxypropanoate dehydrogenase